MAQLIYDLVYREKGEKKSRQLKIDFVSNYMRREIAEYFSLAYQVKYNWDRINDLAATIASERVRKEDGYKERIDALNVEKEALTDEVLKHNNSGLPERNINLVIELLQDNGVKDETILTPKFWDRSVEPSAIIEILSKAMDKDVSSKKKVI